MAATRQRARSLVNSPSAALRADAGAIDKTAERARPSLVATAMKVSTPHSASSVAWGRSSNRKPTVNGGLSIAAPFNGESAIGNKPFRVGTAYNSERSYRTRSLPCHRDRSELRSTLFLAAFNSERRFRPFRASNSERSARLRHSATGLGS